MLYVFKKEDCDCRFCLYYTDERACWVSKRKSHGVAFSRRDTPQSKECAEPSMRRREQTTM